jgi:hypothetical protein
MEVLQGRSWQKGIWVMRKTAGAIIIAIGSYFIIVPFM